MRIDVQEFTVFLTENEVWDLLFCIEKQVLAACEHAAKWSGWETLKDNHNRILEMHKQFATRLERVDLVKSLEKRALEAIKALQENETS